MFDCSRASRDELAAVVEFIAELNAKAEHRIGYVGDNRGEIARDLVEYGAIDNAFVAKHDGELVGFMAMDVDEELGRSYLLGPWANLADWDEIAHRLVDECIAIVSGGTVTQLDMFFDVANANVSRLGNTLGFETYKDVRTLRFDRSDLNNIEPGTATPVETRHHDSLVKLHDRTFPNTYLPGARMVAGLGENKVCFVRTESDEVLGYVYLEVDDTIGSASVEFLGTEERAQGRGIGTDLVRTGLHWMFDFETVSETWLVVDEDNAGARRLYDRLGWTEVHRLTSMRRSGRLDL